MWNSTVGLVNGRHRYLTAETFGFKINSNGQMLKKRQQWTIEPFPEISGPDGSISSAASVSSQCIGIGNQQPAQSPQQPSPPLSQADPYILTFSSGQVGSSLTSVKSSSNGSSTSDQDACGEEHENVAIKSHLNKYLAVDSFGNVTCDSDEKTENARFTITICSMSQGRSKDEHIFWAFKNVERGYYLGTTEDGMICCNAKMPKSRAELWHLHLIPARGASFFAIKSLGRKRFARVVDEVSNQDSDKAQVQLDATISWGPETLFQFKYYEGGRYSILTSDCMYLTHEGYCVKWKAPDESTLPAPECLFTLEYHSGFLALRDLFSHYLAAAGRSSILKSRSIGVSRDELFVFECAPIQVSLKATFNNRWVSIKQGVDLSANQTETSSKFEIFQLTYHKQTQNWSIMTHDCNFWTVSQNTTTISVCKPGDYEGLTRGQFKLIWSDSDATCSLKYIDVNRQERWISARKSGQLFLASGTQTPVKFIMRFQNRRLLNLRPVDGSGFVGLKTNSKQLEATKTSPDSIAIEYSEPPNLNGAGLNHEAILKNIDNNQHPLSRLHPPEVGPKPVVKDQQQTISLFNVRLNSTKMGQSVLDKLSSPHNNINTSVTPMQEQAKQEALEELSQQKDVDFGVDDNNNNNSNEELEVAKLNGGSVELASTPSVASIISSFSNTKIGRSNQPSESMSKPQQACQISTNRSVFKLASTFDNLAASPQLFQQQQAANDLDTASDITSCSTASASSSFHSGSSTTNDQYLAAHGSINSKSSAELLAQFECCYLKSISNDRYLVVSEQDNSSLVCDATNKACAQPWILELRSHNAIAIRASDNHAYIQLGTNGTIFLSRCDPKEASLWEF